MGGNVLYLDVELRRIRKMLEESWPQKVERQAEQSRKAGEQMAGYEAWGRNRGLTYIPPKYKPEPSDAA